MGPQSFYLINLTEAFYSVKSYAGVILGGWKIGEWYFGSDIGETLFYRLAIPKIKLPDDPLEGKFFLSASKTGIHALPQETQQQILDELEDFSDTFCFSLTSRYMWAIGIRTLRRLYFSWALRECGAWAGHRLMIIGYYADEGPDGLFSQLQKDFMDDYREADESGLYRPLRRIASDMAVETTRESAGSELRFRLAERGGFYDTPPWMDKFMTWTNEHTRLYYPTNPVLRNITKKEYVRSDALDLPHGYRVIPDRSPLTLGHALMSRTVWSSHSDVSMLLSAEFADKFVHGVWAGCAFDIVSLGEWKDNDWKDVSVEVKEDMMYLAVQEGQLIYEPESVGDDD